MSLSYLTHTQEVSMIMSRLLRDVDALRHLISLWKIQENQWNREFYSKIYQEHADIPSVIDRHFLIFDIHHFYPKFLAKLNPDTKRYELMTIREKIGILKRLNSDEDTISVRRKSLYLFRRNRVDESRNYPMDHMIHENSAEYLVGVMNYSSHHVLFGHSQHRLGK